MEKDNDMSIDLSEFISKKVGNKISKLEEKIVELEHKQESDYVEKKNLNAKVRDLETKNNNILQDNTSSLFLLSYLKDNFNNIEPTPRDKDGYGQKSKTQNQYIYIENIMKNIFNVNPDYQNGFFCPDFKVSLSVNFYSNRDVLVNLLDILLTDNKYAIIGFIKSFKMPFDYNKEDVIEYVKSPRYNTNGAIFGISSHWGGGKGNMPHDLIMKNPFILEDDVFDMMLETIKSKKDNHGYLFSLPIYNKNISDEQIIKLGECLIGIRINDYHSKFIEQNILKFNDETVDYLFSSLTCDNPYRLLHWGKFPVKYQYKYLLIEPIDVVLKHFSDYSCKWTTEQKDEFLKEKYK